MAKTEGMSTNAKLFWGTLGVLGLLLIGLVLFSMSGPDAPFTYAIQ